MGAAKAGTTWLYERLKELEEFDLPSVKEFHYFDRDRIYSERNFYPSINHLEETHLHKRIFDKGFRNRCIFNIFRALKTKNKKQIKFLLKWYCSNYNDNWYLSIFENFEGITGEITPSYAILNENDFLKLYNLLPDIKIIYLLRDPVERAWSSYRFSLNFKNDYSHKNLNEIEKIKLFLNSPNQLLASNYLYTIDLYQKYYSNKMLLGFYDAIKEQPKDLLVGIVDFLKGDSSKIEDKNLVKKSNVSRKIEMPKEIEDFLIEKYTPLMEEMSKRYGGYCDGWLNKYCNNKKLNQKVNKKLNDSFIKL